MLGKGDVELAFDVIVLEAVAREAIVNELDFDVDILEVVEINDDIILEAVVM